ncbi:interferon-inducible GTPase-domain-containing protein [Sphaerosporella brunnea]|uniref:Interferon-inducible GTPase-domain-containing protein n=1 Tax=Sphaerosporella brunnea TaxID=1250544 RepID=A0A5J5EVN1_9PEZI|nr:interferon-inducible GTPase-domain-containing protein [Sphaerosporella brunnea]
MEEARKAKQAAEGKAKASRQREEAARKQAEEARKKEKAAEEKAKASRQKEEAARKQTEEARKKEKAAEEKAKASYQKEEAARKQTEEARKKEKAAEEKAKASLQKEEAALRKEKEALARAKDLEAGAAEAIRQKEQLEQKANDALRNLALGIQPVVWPTIQELAEAKAKAEYREDKLHFAVCGPSGSGKSSMINALRGLKKNQPGAAKTGVVECTETLHRYPDPRKQMPYPRFVWYDVPGAGTSKIPGWQYFNQQGLYIFDFIILVYDMRFTQIDADILENCKRFKIPAFIVRAKADQHIHNMMLENEDLEYSQARDEFVNETQRDLKSNLREYGLWNEPDPLPLRIVSNGALYDFIKDSEERSIENETGVLLPAAERKGGKKMAQYIDEPALVHDLLKTAYERRYAGKQQTSGGSSAIVAAAAALSDGLSKLGMGATPKS